MAGWQDGRIAGLQDGRIAGLQDCRIAEREGRRKKGALSFLSFVPFLPAILQSYNPAMTRFVITVAYDGTGLVGWQRQASGTSVQALLEEAVAAIAGCAVAVTGAGRTDAGVHALGQAASFALPR